MQEMHRDLSKNGRNICFDRDFCFGNDAGAPKKADDCISKQINGVIKMNKNEENIRKQEK